MSEQAQNAVQTVKQHHVYYMLHSGTQEARDAIVSN
jgi:hypothetical protein